MNRPVTDICLPTKEPTEIQISQMKFITRIRELAVVLKQNRRKKNKFRMAR
jgi:hypothetical protein